MSKAFNAEGEEIEVYTAEEKQAEINAAVKTAEENFGKTKEQIEKERDEARSALAERTGEFAKFRKLSDDQVKQLSEKDRIIYENGLALQKANEDRITAENKAKESAVDAAIAAKAGTNEKLKAKMKEMWPIIAVEATTPEEIEQKTKMILGAIGTTEPDLVATVAGFSGGSFEPPKKEGEGDGKTFADTEKGKAAAADLGLTLEVPKDQK